MRSNEARLERVGQRLPAKLALGMLLGTSALFCAVAVHALDTRNNTLLGACAGVLMIALLLLLSFERLAVLAIGFSPIAIPLGYSFAKALNLANADVYSLDLGTSQVLLAAAVVALLIVARNRRENASLTLPPWPVTAYALLGFIPLIGSFAFTLGLSGILAVWSAWAVELVLLSLPWQTVKRCLLVFAGTTVIGALIGIAAYASKLGPLAALYAKVYKPRAVMASGMPLTPLAQSLLSPMQLATLGHRLNFNTGHPNAYAGFLVSACVLGLAGIALSRLSRRRKFILIAAYLAVVLTALVLTLSRTGVVAMAVMFVCLGALLLRNPRLRHIILGFVAVGLVIAAISPYFLNPTSSTGVVGRFATLSQGWQDASLQVRLQLWHKLVPLVLHHPLGMGYGYFNNPALPQQLGLDWTTPIFSGHNVHVDIAVESGIPGMLAFIAIWILAARQALKLYRSEGEAQLVGAFVLAGIAGFLTVSLANATSALESMPMIALFMLFVLPYCARRELT